MYSPQTNDCIVNYLSCDENGFLFLKETNAIDTQVQIQMYVIIIPNCDWYMYSKSGSTLVFVRRGNQDIIEFDCFLNILYSLCLGTQIFSHS